MEFIVERKNQVPRPGDGSIQQCFVVSILRKNGTIFNFGFAAMDLAAQMHQFDVYKKCRSTWNIKEQVLE